MLSHSRHRSQGREQEEIIRSDADRQRQVILAEAQREAEKIRGEGDARSTEIYAEAYNSDTEFYSFHRSLQAYEKSFSGSNLTGASRPVNSLFW